MFKTIVVGTDWSGTAELAFTKAFQLARAEGARLHVVTATVPAPTPASGATAGASAGRTLGPDFQADRALEQTLERIGETGRDVQQHMATSEPADAILAVADQVGADLIVVGNQGMHRRVLGSIPNKVSHRALCDVLIVQTGG